MLSNNATSRKDVFFEKLKSAESSKTENSILFTNDEVDVMIHEIKTAQSLTTSKTKRQYHLLSNYNVLTIDGFDRLIKRYKSNQAEQPKIVLGIESFYDQLLEAHLATGHGGRDRMRYELSKRFSNITLDAIVDFISLCVECQLKRKKSHRGVVVKPILSNTFHSRAQVDLIDFQSQPDGEYRFILDYQDHFTKFIQLRPLKRKTAAEVADALLEIFSIFGAPHVLQADNGKEFSNKHLLQLISQNWPECKMVHGKPRHSQSQGSVERSNDDVQTQLTCWMRDNGSTEWAKALPRIQFQKNRSLHKALGRSPFEALFGEPPKVGLSSLKPLLSAETYNSLETEDDLLAALNNDTASNENLERQSTDDNLVGAHSDENESISAAGLKNLASEAQNQNDDVHRQLDRNLASRTPLDLSTSVSHQQRQLDAQDSTIGVLPETNAACDGPTPRISVPSAADSGVENYESGDSVCVACGDVYGGSHTCPSCKRPCHNDGECVGPMKDGDVIVEVCKHCLRRFHIEQHRAAGKHGLERQAAAMSEASNKRFCPAEVGQSVVVAVSNLDRGKADPRNVLAVVTDKTGDGFYSLGTKEGQLPQLFSRNQFSVCSASFLSATDVPNTEISLRKAVTGDSVGTGQGYLRCSCTTKCTTDRCKCRKGGHQCNSRCHNSLSCANK